MPAELSILFRYKCDIKDCAIYFKWRAEVAEHKLQQHESDSDVGHTSDNSSATSPTIAMAPRQEQNVKCTYEKCRKMFDTKQEMIKHKINDPKHDFCPTCPVKNEDGDILLDENRKEIRGVDCKDWNDFIKHKVESEKHISCPLCGQDFKSKGGLKGHVKQAHPTKQQLKCLGCGVMFASGSDIVKHVEQGRCQNKKNPAASIKREDFYGSIQRKSIMKDILKHHDPSSVFTGSSVGSLASDLSSLTTDTSASRASSISGASLVRNDASCISSSTMQTNGGGVLLDQDIEAYPALTAPLQPSAAPRMQPQAKAGRGRTVTRASSVSRPGWDASSLSSESTTSTMRALPNDRSNGFSPVARTVNGYAMSSADASTKVRDGDTTSTRLFPNARYNLTAQPVSAATFAAMKHNIDVEHARNVRAPGSRRSVDSESNAPSQSTNGLLDSGNGINMFHQNFWNPDNPGYTAERFFDQLLQVYVCPFPSCERTVDSPSGLSDHLRSNHRMTEFSCPSCQRRFKTASDLIAHCESPSTRCTIRHSEKFNEFIDLVSGGILGVKRERTYRDREMNRDDGDEVEEKSGWGIDKRNELANALRGSQLRFEAQKPLGFGN